MFEGKTVLTLSGAKAGAGCTVANPTNAYRFVKMSGDNTVVPCAGATDVPVGVLQAVVAAVGEPVTVVVIGECLIQADAAITAGDPIACSADGQAQTAVATQSVVGQAINVAGGTTAGNLITAVVNCASPGIKA